MPKNEYLIGEKPLLVIEIGTASNGYPYAQPKLTPEGLLKIGVAWNRYLESLAEQENIF